jgi:hypothetical protein
MKDQEPDHKGDAVGRQVEALGERHLFDPVQAQVARLGVRELAGKG